MAYCTAQEVRTFTGATPETFRLKKDDTTGLNNIIISWISQSESIIDSYCNTTWPGEVPGLVQNVCLRLAANMVALAVARRDTPLIKVNDWTIRISSSDIFTQDLKDDLKPFVVDKSYKSDAIDIFTITGED